MNGLAVFGIIIFIIVMSAKPEGEFPTRYDYIDLNIVLQNKRLLKNYVKCLTNTGKCSPDGNELKISLPDALRTNCSKCSERQRVGSRLVLLHLIKNEPEHWAALSKIYDPDGEFIEKYREDARRDGIFF